MGRKRQKLGGWVYFLSEEGTQRVKIGWSIDPDSVAQSGSRLNSRKLDVLCGVPVDWFSPLFGVGTGSLELAMHERFANNKISGEWFDASPGTVLFEFICDYAKEFFYGGRWDLVVERYVGINPVDVAFAEHLRRAANERVR